MTNETQNKAIRSMVTWSEYFAEDRNAFYKAEAAGELKTKLKALDEALGSAQLAIHYCEKAGFDPRFVMQVTIHFLETFGTEEYSNLIKASA